jgi:hypothetical protein
MSTPQQGTFTAIKSWKKAEELATSMASLQNPDRFLFFGTPLAITYPGGSRWSGGTRRPH